MIKILILLLLISNILYGQSKIEDDLKFFLRTGKNLFAAPAEFKNDDLNKFIFSSAASAVSFGLDEPLKGIARQNRTPFANELFKIDDYFYIEFMAASIIGLYSYGLASKDEEIRKLGRNIFISSLAAATSTMTAKAIIGRARPFEEKGNSNFNLFSFKNSSFPSTHAALAFAYSAVMAQYSNSFAWKVFWYSSAAMVGLARVYNNQHWFSDVVFGSALGYFIGEFVLNQRAEDSKSNFMINAKINF